MFVSNYAIALIILSVSVLVIMTTVPLFKHYIKWNINKVSENLNRETMAENRNKEKLGRLLFNCLVLMDLGIYWEFLEVDRFISVVEETLAGLGAVATERNVYVVRTVWEAVTAMA